MKKELFYKWLLEIGRSEATSSHYTTAIDTISEELSEHNKFSGSIYSVNDYRIIDSLLEDYLGIEEFYNKNKRGNNMYSCAMKKYSNFLNN